MKVHDAALKHGIQPGDAIQAATWAIWIEDLDGIHRLASYGLDSTLHAMKARPQMLDLLP